MPKRGRNTAKTRIPRTTVSPPSHFAVSFLHRHTHLPVHLIRGYSTKYAGSPFLALPLKCRVSCWLNVLNITYWDFHPCPIPATSWYDNTPPQCPVSSPSMPGSMDNERLVRLFKSWFTLKRTCSSYLEDELTTRTRTITVTNPNLEHQLGPLLWCTRLMM